MSSHSLVPEVVYPDTGAIDLGSQEHYACAGDTDADVRCFGATTQAVREMAAWFKEKHVRHVVMESTGVYWMTVYDIMEEAGFDVALVNAAHVHNVPGRKSDVADCQWLRKVYALGFLNDSFVPPDIVRTLRTLVRQRDSHITEQGRQIQLMQKALDQMNIKLHGVISELDGASGMRIVRAILDGERDPHVLLGLADKRIRNNKAQAVLAALEGIWKPVYLFTLRQAVSGYDFCARQIAECDTEIEQTLALMRQTDAPLDGPRKPMQNHPVSFDLQERLMQSTGGVDLCKLTGLAPQNTLQIISETGTDMSRFKTEKHFVSWCSLSPPKRSSGKRQKLPKRQWHPGTRSGQMFRLAARVIGQSHSALGAFYRRIKARQGPQVANKATARKLATLVYNALKNGTPIQQLTDKDYERNYAQYRTKLVLKQAKAIGLTLVPTIA